MKDWLCVIKLLVKSMFKKNTNERKGLKIFVGFSLALLYAVILFGICSTIVAIAPALIEYELQSEALMLLFAVGILVILIFGTTSILTVLYFSRDTEFFMSLPVSPSTVFFAKLTTVYLGMLALEAAIMAPCLITLGVMLKMSAVFYIVGFFAVLTLPALPLMLASVIAIPLMYVVSLFRNKGAMTSIVAIIMFGLFFAGYYIIIMNVSSGDAGDGTDISAIVIGIKDSLKKAADILLPISAVARLATLTPVYGLGVGLSSLVNTAIYIGFTAVLFLIAYLLSNLAYRKGVSRMTEGSRRNDGKHREFKSSGNITSALMRTEWRQMVRTPAFAINCLMCVVVLPLIIGVMNFTAVDMSGAAAEDAEFVKGMYGLINITILFMMGVGLNYGASTCITREGESFGFGKSLPVTPVQWVKAKRIVYLLISYAAIVLGCIVSLFTAQDIWTVIVGLGFLVPYNYAFVNFAIYYDLTAPFLKWTTPREAMKRNFKGMVPFLINMGMSVLFMFVTLSPKIAMLVMPEYAAAIGMLTVVIWGVLYIVAFILAFVFHRKLTKKASALYERIEI